MSGVASAGGRMTPSLRCSLSLRVEPVDGSVGSIFSAGMSLGAGMLGACCGKVGICAKAPEPRQRENTDGDRSNTSWIHSFRKENGSLLSSGSGLN